MRESGLDEEAFATALAIAVLDKHAGGEQATWDDAARKPTAWIDARGLRVEGINPVDWLLQRIGQG